MLISIKESVGIKKRKGGEIIELWYYKDLRDWLSCYDVSELLTISVSYTFQVSSYWDLTAL